jgi:uncharacterized protein (TIGR00645 family)
MPDFSPRGNILVMIERALERMIYASRWLLAPIYLGMSLALVALAIKFFHELYHTLRHIIEINEADLILSLLGLVDLSLVGSLLVMVTFSGYENMVSQLDIDEDDTEKLSWLGKHDYGSLKLKVAASIVAISSIHLLRIFMNAEQTANDKMLWYVVIHLTLVLSAVFMGISDKIQEKR